MFKYKITIIFIIIIIFAFLILHYTLFSKQNKFNNSNSTSNLSDSELLVNKDDNSCSSNGWLQTKNGVIANQNGKIIQLRGVSSHSLDWYYDVITYDNLKYLKETWNNNVFRIAIYTDVDGNGYIYNQDETKQKIYTIINNAIQLDMYVIVDWHILADNSPQIYKSEAIQFFDEISNKYSNTPNVIYEICNEPNGSNVTWDSDVKPYAEEVISVIRNNSKKSLIIVGTPAWCTDLDSVINNPLKFDNIIYSCHFYSGTHGKELQDKITNCINKNIPIIVSECGLTNTSGNGTVFFDEFKRWIDYLNSFNISWVYWSFSNKGESSSIISTNYNSDTSNSLLRENLTNSGSFIEYIFESYNK